MKNIRTFAVIPDEFLGEGTHVLVGIKDMDYQEMKHFLKNNSFIEYIRNVKLWKYFDMARDCITSVEDNDGNIVYVAGYKFYKPWYWSERKARSELKSCFDEYMVL